MTTGAGRHRCDLNSAAHPALNVCTDVICKESPGFEQILAINPEESVKSVKSVDSLCSFFEHGASKRIHMARAGACYNPSP